MNRKKSHFKMKKLYERSFLASLFCVSNSRYAAVNSREIRPTNVFKRSIRYFLEATFAAQSITKSGCVRLIRQLSPRITEGVASIDNIPAGCKRRHQSAHTRPILMPFRFEYVIRSVAIQFGITDHSNALSLARELVRTVIQKF